MSDSAFWDPSMFTDTNIEQIMEDDELYNDGEGRPATPGPSKRSTPGRRYLQTAAVKFTDKKVYIYEVNAYHTNAEHGYNVRGQKSTVLFYDGHAANVSSSSNEDRAGDLFYPMKCQMGWTPDPPEADDPLYWYYGTTYNGIHGRDFD
jgi:prepilin-type processing-associated H-X9-DG protein